MLGNTKALANIAVRDINAARKFYESVLGLKVTGNFGEEVLNFSSGSTPIIVYRSDFAGTNKATALGWEVGSKIEEIVNELKSKGVRFEHYDAPDMKLVGDIHEGSGMKAAWFKDPDGNILSLMGV